MAVGGGVQNLRKALGAVKDTTTVGLVKVNSEYKELDVAIVKATNHVELLAKEKHIQTIFAAVSSSRHRADVAYCLNALAKRLAKTHNWTVAVKTLIIIHRALREVGPSFLEELLNYSRGRGLMLNMSHFKDDSCPTAWDCSAWVRSYALYLEERMECYRMLNYDVETDRSRMRNLDNTRLLDQLPALQQLLFRVLSCQPEGAATYTMLIQYALSMIAGESIHFYVAITDGVLNMVEKYFEMQRHDAVRAFEIYRRADSQAERLSRFLEICRSLDHRRGLKYIKIEKPPVSFMVAMEEYLKDAPCTLMIEWKEVNCEIDTNPTEVPDPDTDPVPDLLIDCDQGVDVEEKPYSPIAPAKPEPLKIETIEDPVTQQVDDLLGLAHSNQEALKLDEQNALALSIFTPDQTNVENDFNLLGESSGWELALVTASSSNEAAVVQSKLGGGLDKLTLDSLYDDAIARRMNPNGTYQQAVSNPFEVAPSCYDPFYASSNIAPPTNVQMAVMNQQAVMMQQVQHLNNPFADTSNGQIAASYPSQNTYTGLI